MGVYDTLLVEADVGLPKFPRDRSPGEITWQTKEIGHPSLRTYKLAASGRLLRREQETREKTAEEKRSEAAEHGFDSWDEYVSFCTEAAPEELLDRGHSLGLPNEQTVVEEFWLDHNMHGTFEFHGSRDDIEDGFFWSYEARFTRGDLDAIVFLGERHGSGPDAYKPDAADITHFS